jgi:hypothetical protein
MHLHLEHHTAVNQQAAWQSPFHRFYIAEFEVLLSGVLMCASSTCSRQHHKGACLCMQRLKATLAQASTRRGTAFVMPDAHGAQELSSVLVVQVLSMQDHVAVPLLAHRAPQHMHSAASSVADTLEVDQCSDLDLQTRMVTPNDHQKRYSL